MTNTYETTLARVNLNGDNADTLIDQYRAIRDACFDLEKALNAATPHGRNYQTLGTGEFIARANDLGYVRQAHSEVQLIGEWALNSALAIMDQKA